MKYITTIRDLKEKALKDLGRMTEATYDEFMKQAESVARRKGVIRPKLMIYMAYKDPQKNPARTKEAIYPISKGEWKGIIGQIEEYFDVAPRVYVVDGNKYTGLI